MKLLEVEVSMSGLAKRRGLLDKLKTELAKDWTTLEAVQEERGRLDVRSLYKAKLDEFNQRSEALAP